MMARAIAKEAGACMISINASTISDMWFGESVKKVAGLFSLARKMAPCIIFIDEIDCFFQSRGATTDCTALTRIMNEFMIQWDGLTSNLDSAEPVVVIGATNRRRDVDLAILRRMPTTITFPLPSPPARLNILQILLKDQTLASDMDLEEIMRETEGMSGSDLREICRLS